MEGDVKTDLREPMCEGVNWAQVAYNRVQLRDLLKVVTDS